MGEERRSAARLEADKILLDLENRKDDELKKVLDELYEEEKQISYRRRMLHGKIDIVRRELVHRLSNKHKQGKSLFSNKDVTKLTKIISKTLTKDINNNPVEK